MIEIISLGGGVQSTTMVLMNHHGEIDPPAECAIFADTGWERKSTYQVIDWLKSFIDIPIYIVSGGDIRVDAAQLGDGHMPFYTDSQKGVGRLRRQCTGYYKIYPIRRKIREIYGLQPISQWIGISVNEMVRMRKSDVRYITNRYPLIEKPRRMSRNDCRRWLEKHGYPIPARSACIGCPFHTNTEWLNLDKNELAEAISFDEKIRDRDSEGRLYLHRSGKPLKDAIPDPSHQIDFLEDILDKSEDCAGGCWL